MDKFWDKKIETSTTITYEGNKQFEKEDYHFIITLRDNELSQIEVRHIVHGTIDYSCKSVKFNNTADLENFIKMLKWLKEQIK